MYQKIMLALDTTDADRCLLNHVTGLAKIHGSKLLLVHVADGWAARNYDTLKLAESEEMKADQTYLDQSAERLRDAGFDVKTILAKGNPPTEILKIAVSESCDLIAMTSHGHRFIADMVLGSTIDAVRHKTHIPLLIVRAEPA